MPPPKVAPGTLTSTAVPPAGSEPAEPAADSEPAEPAAGSPAGGATFAATLPEPHSPATDGPLTTDEAAELAMCEQVILAQTYAMVWVIGKALAVINRGRLYREKYARFDDYVQAEWEVSPARAYQLIGAYPVAEQLATATGTDLRHVAEGQLRALMPVVKRHGVDDAVMVFTTVREVATTVDGATVTAKIISKVAGQLPGGQLNRADVAERAKMVLTAAGSDPLPLSPWPTARDNALKALRKVAGANADPDEVRAAIGEYRQVLDEIEAAITSGESGGGDE
jgi:hypothetical protein